MGGGPLLMYAADAIVAYGPLQEAVARRDRGYLTTRTGV